MRNVIRMTHVALVLLCLGVAQAEEKIETVLDGLKNPCGVAIQPETGQIFVSHSAAGKIVRVVDGKTEDVITGSSLDVYGDGPTYDIGPLGIAFVNSHRLAVADGGYKDGEEYVRIFEVPEPGTPALTWEDGTKIGPLAATEDAKAEGNFFGLAATQAALFVTCNGAETRGCVAKADSSGTKFGTLQRFVATHEAVQVNAPVGITISPRGEVVIGQMGQINVEKDSLLTFYNANNAKMLLSTETGLYDITALVYSPKGHLYALDFAWMAPDKGGLFRLDKQGDGCQAVKITSLDKPTALAFGKDGSLYITLFGTGSEGQLINLAPGL